MYYLCSKNKGADQLVVTVFANADCWFSHEAAHFSHEDFAMKIFLYKLKFIVLGKSLTSFFFFIIIINIAKEYSSQ